MPRNSNAEFEPTIAVFERSNTVRTLDRAATGAGLLFHCLRTVGLFMFCRAPRVSQSQLLIFQLL